MPTFHDETVQIRIEEQLHIRPFGPEDPLLVEHKWFVRCQYGQVSRKPLVAFPSDLFEMLGVAAHALPLDRWRILRCHWLSFGLTAVLFAVGDSASGPAALVE